MSIPLFQELGGMEVHSLKQQVQAGDFFEMRRVLARTYRAKDWQDRHFLVDQIAPHLLWAALQNAAAAEPNAADLCLLSGGYLFDQLGKSRGTNSAENTSNEQFRDASQQLQAMMQSLMQVSVLDPEDPTPHVFAIRGLVVFSTYEDRLRQEYADAVRIAPGFVPAHSAMVNARSLKWGGSHAESLSVARAAMQVARPGSDMAACLFLAHFLVWQYARIFDKNKAEADRYIKDRSVAEELNQALDTWLSGDYRGHRSSVAYFHQAALWYHLSGDDVRLRRVLALTAGVRHDRLWNQIGAPGTSYAAALQKRVSQEKKPEKKSGFLGLFKR